jgi:hypothetical protein
MAIQITTATNSDTYILETPSTDIASGQMQSSMIAAFEVGLTPGSELPNTLAVHFMIKNSVFLMEIYQGTGGTNTIKFFLLGGTTVSPTAQFTAGAPIFVAMTWDGVGGAQTFWVNGIEVATGAVSGALTTNSSTMNIGMDTGEVGATLTISQVAVFDGYILTSSEIQGLVLGTTTPLTTATHATWYPTLTGTLNAAPQVGDSGLSNSGTAGAGTGNKYVLSTISKSSGGSAIYVPDLVWSPAVVPLPYVSASGHLLVVGIVEVGGSGISTAINPTGVSATLPTVMVNSATASVYGPVWADSSKDLPYVTYQFLTPVLATDTVSATMPFAMITTALGTTGQVSNMSVSNYVGQYEPGFNGLTGFTPNPKMPVGVDNGYNIFLYNFNSCPAKNARYRLSGIGSTYDSNLQPLTIPAGTATSCFLWNSSEGSNFDAFGGPTPAGVWCITFKDVNALDPVNYLKVWLYGNFNTCGGCDGNNINSRGPGLQAGSTYVRSVAADGVSVTVSYWLSYKDVAGYTYGHDFNLSLFAKSATGYWGHNNTITDFWIFIPGDSTTTMYNTTYSSTSQTVAPCTTGWAGPAPYTGPFPNSSGNDTSDPWAISSYYKTLATTANGNNPPILRVMEGTGGDTNFVNIGDVPSPNLWCYAHQEPAPTITITELRPYNTNPASTTYSWSSTKLYMNILGFDGTDSVGNYIDLSLHTSSTTGHLGTLDMGAFMTNFEGNYVAIEAVCSAPHGLRGGDLLQFPNNNFPTPTFNGPFYIPCTGLTPTPYSGTVQVTNLGTTIIFSGTQTITNAQDLTFSTDATGQAYQVSPGGTGQTFSIYPPYQGTSSTTATANLVGACNLYGLIPFVFPTSATTFVFPCNHYVSSNGLQTLSGTTPVTLNNGKPFNVILAPPYGCAPYEFYAHLATQMGAVPWFEIRPYMTDAALQQLAINISAWVKPNSTVYFEHVLEHWNASFLGGWYDGTWGTLLDYISPGTVVNNYVTIPASGSAVLTPDQAYAVLSAHQHDMLQAGFDTAGTGCIVGRIFGTQYTGPHHTQNMIPWAQTIAGPLTKQVAMGPIVMAPYINSPYWNTTWLHACATTGTNPGSWPCPAILDWARHYLKYSNSLWGDYSSQTSAIAPYATAGGPTVDGAGRAIVGQVGGLPSLASYEGQYQSIDPAGGIELQHDLFYSPGPYPPYTGIYATYTAFLQSMQDGDPRVPGSGLSLAVIYSLGTNWHGVNGQQMWSLHIYQYQAIGTGVGNVFSTAQGGTAGPHGYGTGYDGINQTIEMQATQDWWDVTNHHTAPGTGHRWYYGDRTGLQRAYTRRNRFHQ